jgi:hypothetical protein
MVSQNLTVVKEKDAKPFLIHSAILESILENSAQLDLDAAKFKEKLETKFEKYFEDYKKRQISEHFGKNYSVNLSEDQKKEFFKGLEAHRLKIFVGFAKLDRLVDSYAFKELSKDAADPSIWKASIVLNLNKVKIQRYLSRLDSTETKQYSRMQILTEISLQGFDWRDLSLESSSSFTDPLMDSWLKWLTTHQPSNLEETGICTGSCIDQFDNWQQIPQEEGMSVPEEILNGLWLKVSLNVKKVAFRAAINEWEFEWEGSVVVLDVNTKKILGSYNLEAESKTWRNLDQKALNSALVSALYRSTLDSFGRLVRKVQEAPKLNRLSRLVIQGHRHMGDVLLLTDLLRRRGSNLNLELMIDVFSRNEAQLLCFYQGEEKSFSDLLSQVKELKSSQSYSLVNEFTGVHHLLKLVAE